jgi:hypothetical protein
MMTAQVLLLLAQIMTASDGQSVDIQRNGQEIQIKVDGEQYRMIQPVIGEAAVYINSNE